MSSYRICLCHVVNYVIDSRLQSFKTKLYIYIYIYIYICSLVDSVISSDIFDVNKNWLNVYNVILLYRFNCLVGFLVIVKHTTLHVKINLFRHIRCQHFNVVTKSFK